MMEAKPDWLKVPFNASRVDEVDNLMDGLKLNTVCHAANCPNLGECYRKQTATFMIMGTQCTRNCRFCNVTFGRPQDLDPMEPKNLAEASKKLGLSHVVITSVTRDDLPDGGAAHFAQTVEEVRKECPDTTIEVLIPDLKGDEDALNVVLAAKPDVFNHNMETIERLYSTIRPQAIYERSLAVLRYAKEQSPEIATKTGIMLGLGETQEEVEVLMDDVLATGCDILTIGQYLQPSPEHAPMVEYITPEQFDEYKRIALEKGFAYVASSPLVRSSYRAAEALNKKRVIL